MKYRARPVYAVQYVKQSQNLKECFNSYPLWLDNALDGALNTVNKLKYRVTYDNYPVFSLENDEIYYIELTDWIIYTTYENYAGMCNVYVCSEEQFWRTYEEVKE